MTKHTFPQLIAHRGASIYAPENTLAALRKAAELGASWVESDIAITSCGEAIILHDSTLNRTTNGRGEVSKTSCADIRQLDAGSWFAPEFKDERIPTLDEWLSCAAALDLGLNLELKVPANQAEFAVKRLLESLERHWSSDYSKLLISSFTLENLKTVYKASKKLALGFLSRTWSSRDGDIVKSLNCASINLSRQSIDAKLMKQLEAYEIPVLAYTVDDKALAEHLFELGVTGVFSNDPCLLKKNDCQVSE